MGWLTALGQEVSPSTHPPRPEPVSRDVGRVNVEMASSPKVAKLAIQQLAHACDEHDALALFVEQAVQGGVNLGFVHTGGI